MRRPIEIELPCTNIRVKSLTVMLATKSLAGVTIRGAQSVADPGFPRGGDANFGGGRQPIIWPIFPKNCMKMKKF